MKRLSVGSKIEFSELHDGVYVVIKWLGKEFLGKNRYLVRFKDHSPTVIIV